ncbi:MAG: DUF998 domain-containing protein [Jiangellales bacterium]
MTRQTLLARLLVVLGVVGFWVFASVGAAQQPGYDAAADYLSSLAATGAVEPVWGLLMFASATMAVLAAAWHVRSPLLAAAAVSLAAAGVFRVDCPTGAAGCNAGPLVVEPSLAGQVHAGAVVGYQLLLTAALLVIAVSDRRAGRRGYAVAALVAALVPLLLALNPLPLDPGVSQRLWVMAGQAALLMLAARPGARATVRP